MAIGNDGVQYLKVKKDKQAYLGVKYFKFNFSEERVIQVCCHPGELVRRGRTNAIGIYTVSKMTLLSNYLGMSYLENCTKKEYENKFEEVVKILS